MTADSEKICPYCGGKVSFDHVDDVGTEFFKCEKCGEQTPKPMLQKEHGSTTPQETVKKIKSFALSKLRDDYGYNIRRTDVGYVLLDATFEGVPPDPMYSFKSLTSDKVKEQLAEHTEAPTELIERALAELSVQAKNKRGRKKQFENIQIVSAQEVEGEPVVLDHLSEIENPAVAGKPVVVEAVVSSTSVAYLAPAEMEVHVTDKDGNEDVRTVSIGERNVLNMKLIGVNEDIKTRRLRKFVNEVIEEKGKIRTEEKKTRTVYKVRVRPPVFTLEKRQGKIVDEKGYEYKAFDVYVTASEHVYFQPSSLVRLEGTVVANPRTQKVTILSHKVEFPEETCLFNIENLRRLQDKLSRLTVSQRVDWILSNFAIYSQIQGRRNLAFAGFMGYTTPLYVKLSNEVQRGWANVTFIGDTTTAKTLTMRKLIRLLHAGILITAETASTVGLVGTTTQIEKGEWFVDWGFLTLNDRKLLAVDGAHKLPMSQWAALAESERSGIVTIAKAAKDSAYARTRQIKISNPVDREENKFSTKSLQSFLYSVQALATVFDRTSIARLDLAVFVDQRDVKAEEVNIKFDESYDPDLCLLADVLRWCWSNTAKVEFTPEAVTELLDSATRLYRKFFSESIPLCSIDMKWKLARLSTALAFLTLSTADYKTVVVTQEHVKAVVDFIEGEYGKAGLNTLAQEERFEVLAPEDVDVILLKVENKTGLEAGKIKQILRFIVLRGRILKVELKTKFSLAEKNELRPLLAVLSNEGLIKVGRGYYSTPKLIQLYKVLEKEVEKLPRLPQLPTPKRTPQQPLTLEKFVNKKVGDPLSPLAKTANTAKKSEVEFSDDNVTAITDENIIMDIKSWCQTNRNEHSEISLMDFADFIKKVLNQQPQRVIKLAFDQSILMASPNPGKAVVV